MKFYLYLHNNELVFGSDRLYLWDGTQIEVPKGTQKHSEKVTKIETVQKLIKVTSLRHDTFTGILSALIANKTSLSQISKTFDVSDITTRALIELFDLSDTWKAIAKSRKRLAY